MSVCYHQRCPKCATLSTIGDRHDCGRAEALNEVVSAARRLHVAVILWGNGPISQAQETRELAAALEETRAALAKLDGTKEETDD